MNNPKRLLAVILSSMIIMSPAYPAAAAEIDDVQPSAAAVEFEPSGETLTSGDYQYSVSNEQVKIIKYVGTSTAVVIPDTIDGKPVTSLGSNCFNSQNAITSIVIPDTVTFIGSCAFQSCTKMESITLSRNLNKCDGSVFKNCDSLVTVELPNSLTKIPTNFFESCDNLKQVTLSDSVVSIGQCAFYNCIRLEKISIPDSVTTLDSSAFSGCTGLTEVKLPSGLKVIPTSLFSNCNKLTSITLPDSIEKINSSAFIGCSSLTSINIPVSVSSIGSDAFNGCTGLTSVILSANITILNSQVFKDCSSLQSIMIPSSVTEIKSSAFIGCTGLTDVVIPNSVTSIGDGAFNGCSGLRSITLSNSITSLEKNIFKNCSALQYVSMPNELTSIGNYAFFGCSTLYGITIPNTVTSIGSYAFSNCKSLAGIDLPDSVETLGNYAFYACTTLNKVSLSNSLTAIPESCFYGDVALSSITIPDSVQVISKNAFRDCSAISALTLSNTLTTICSYSFFNCSGLTTVVIPNSVTKIDSYAFDGCKNLTKAVVPDSVTTLGSRAFIPNYGLTIYGVNGSAAQTFANTYRISFEEISNMPLSNISKVEKTSIFVGDTINITGAAKGGSGDYKYSYYFKKASASSWSTKTTNTTATTVSISPSAAEEYNIKVVAEDSLGNKDEKIITVKVKAALANKSTVSQTDIMMGDTVTVTGVASGGTGEYTYSYYYKKTTVSTWTVKEENTTSAEVTFTPPQLANYNVKVTVKDSSGKTVSKTITVKVAAKLENTSSVESANIVLGNTINITGAALGGTAPYTYSYYYKQASKTGWNAKAENTTETTTTVKPGSAVDYQIKVVVKDSEDRTAETIINVKVNTTSPVNKSTVESTSIRLGHSINITGAASGGSGNSYTYSYYYKKASASSWTSKALNTSSTRISITPGSAVDYKVRVVVKDTAGKTSEKVFTVNVTDTVPLKNFSEISSETIQLGHTVNISAWANGGTGSYTYSYYFKQAANTGWTKKEVDTSKTTISIFPSKAVDYNFKVVVKDSSGKTAEKIFNVSVK